MDRQSKASGLMSGFSEYPPILTTAGVADLLTMSVQEVRRLTREGQIPARKIGKAYRYFRDEVVEWLDTKTPPESPTDQVRVGGLEPGEAMR